MAQANEYWREQFVKKKSPSILNKWLLNKCDSQINQESSIKSRLIIKKQLSIEPIESLFLKIDSCYSKINLPETLNQM